MTRDLRTRSAAMALLFTVVLASCQGGGASSSIVAEPTPTPPPPAGDDVIAAFLALTADPNLRMHVVVDGKVRVSAAGTTDTVRIGIDMDIKGLDGVGKAVVDTGPADVTVSMLLVGNRAYVDDDGTWTELPDYKPSTPLNPFARLAGPGDLTYRGHEVRDGRRVHHLSVLAWLGGDLTLLEDQGWTETKVDYTLTTMTVDDAGVPIQMDFSGGVSGSYQGLAATAAFEVAYQFTRIGEPVEIPTPS